MVLYILVGHKLQMKHNSCSNIVAIYQYQCPIFAPLRAESQKTWGAPLVNAHDAVARWPLNHTCMALLQDLCQNGMVQAGIKMDRRRIIALTLIASERLFLNKSDTQLAVAHRGSQRQEALQRVSSAALGAASVISRLILP